MSIVHATVKINAPPKRVWDTVMDPDHLEDWVTIHRAVTNVSDRPMTKGSTMDQVLHMRGVSFRVHWTLVDASEPNRAQWEGQGPAHSKAGITYRLSGDAEGPTEFEYSNDFTPPGGRLGMAASRVIVGAASEREADRSLARLKSLLEKD